MSQENGKSEELTFNIGETISGYKLVKKIDEGGFGQVYKVSKNDVEYAMKLESNSLEGGSAIKLEISVLAQLTNHRKETVFPLYLGGGKKPRYHYLVLELLGPNLKMLKEKCPGEVLTEATWSRVGIQCLYALKTMHDNGFVHRDIKPSNFSIGMNTVNSARSRMILLFDFGLARKFVKEKKSSNTQTNTLEVTKSGEVKSVEKKTVKSALNSKRSQKHKKADKVHEKMKLAAKLNGSREKLIMKTTEKVEYTFRIARPKTDFRGTFQYASPNAHELIELGRHDDIWSMMYMIVELYTELPWFLNEDKPVEAYKNDLPLLSLFLDGKKDRFPANVCQTLVEIQTMLENCDYYDHPNYDLVYKFLHRVMRNTKTSWDAPYDWEVAERISEKELSDIIQRAKKKDTTWENPGGFFEKDKWSELRRPPKATVSSTNVAVPAPGPKLMEAKITEVHQKTKSKKKDGKGKKKQQKNVPSKEEHSEGGTDEIKKKKKEAKSGGSTKSVENRPLT